MSQNNLPPPEPNNPPSSDPPLIVPDDSHATGVYPAARPPTPTPEATKPVKAGRGGLTRIELISLMIGILGVILAFFQIVPETTRNRIFGFATEVPTHTPTIQATAILTPTTAPTPTTMTLEDADIGIVVSYFVTPPEQAIPDAQARELINGVYARLVAEFDAFADQFDLGVAFLPPSAVERVQGRTRAIRESSARALADSLGADIVLYGEITQGSGSLIIQPEFYVSPQAFSEALEVTGSYRLGGDIEVTNALDSLASLADTNRILSGRTTAAAQIFAGLVFYVTGDYEQAQIAFEGAETQPGWEATEGREVLNILLGNTHGKIASQVALTGDIPAARAQLDLARTEYEAAMSVNAEYARAYTGLAGVYYLDWNFGVQEGNGSTRDTLIGALDLLREANSAIDQPEEISVQTKPIFTRMQINFALWTYHIDDYTSDELDDIYRDFRASSELIIRRYDDGGNPSLAEMTSETYALRGLALYAESLCPQAVDEFASAHDLAISDSRRMFFSGWLGDCYDNMNQNNDAITAYQRAIDYALLLDEPPLDQIERYETKIDELRANG